MEMELEVELELELEQEMEQELVEKVCHLVEQVCQVEQVICLAEPEVSGDPWSDACCPGETICDSASPAHCHLHFPPCHWPLGVEDCCYAGEAS